MSAVRVILVTVAGPGGHVDVGVRSDATPEELASSLSSVLGIREPWPAAEHRSPPRPGDPGGVRAVLVPGVSLADARVTDGDLVLFRAPPGSYTGAGRIGGAVPAVEPSPAGYPSVGGSGFGAYDDARAASVASAPDSVSAVPMAQDRPGYDPPDTRQRSGDFPADAGWPAVGSPVDGSAGADLPPGHAAADDPPGSVAGEPLADGSPDVRETYGGPPPAAMSGHDPAPDGVSMYAGLPGMTSPYDPLSDGTPPVAGSSGAAAPPAAFPPGSGFAGPDVAATGPLSSMSPDDEQARMPRAGWGSSAGVWTPYARPADAEYPVPDAAAADDYEVGSHPTGTEGVGWPSAGSPESGSYGTYSDADGAGADGYGAHGPGSYGPGSHGADPYGADPYGADQYGADQYGAGSSGAGPHGVGQYGSDPYGADPYGADIVDAEVVEAEVVEAEPADGAGPEEGAPGI